MLLDLIYERKKLYICTRKQTVDVAQLVRAPDCGSVGRGFESHLPPQNEKDVNRRLLLFSHIETSKSLNASFNEVFLSVDSFLLPIIKAHAT